MHVVEETCARAFGSRHRPLIHRRGRGWGEWCHLGIAHPGELSAVESQMFGVRHEGESHVNGFNHIGRTGLKAVQNSVADTGALMSLIESHFPAFTSPAKSGRQRCVLISHFSLGCGARVRGRAVELQRSPTW